MRHARHRCGGTNKCDAMICTAPCANNIIIVRQISGVTLELRQFRALLKRLNTVYDMTPHSWTASQ